MSKKIELSPNETANSLFNRWKTLDKGGRMSLSHAIRNNIKQGIFEESILNDYKSLIETYHKNVANLKASVSPRITESKSENRKDSDELNTYLLQISNDYLKYGFADSEIQDLFVVKNHDNEVDDKYVKRFSTNFWIRLNKILGTEIVGQKSWKQKYSYKLALETLRRNENLIHSFLSRPVNDMGHLENIFLKIIKDNCKITLVQMQLELKKRKEEEKRRQEEMKYQETQEEIIAKFKRRQENLPPTKTYWFEEELL